MFLSSIDLVRQPTSLGARGGRRRLRPRTFREPRYTTSIALTHNCETRCSDAQLIAASAGNPHAFRELYDRWAEPLLAYFYRRVYDPEVAADLLAETFAIAFEKRERFRDTGAPGGTWLYGIAGKEVSRYFRRQRVRRDGDE